MKIRVATTLFAPMILLLARGAPPTAGEAGGRQRGCR
jgi:hypothetical protein